MKAILLSALLLLASAQIIVRNYGCKSFDPTGKCIACSVRFYLDSSSICQPVNPNCNTYDSTNGACLSCYPGFAVVETTCLPAITNSFFDLNCNTFNGSVCVKCSFGYFLNPTTGRCTQTDPNCKTFDSSTGTCTSCFPGFALQQNGKCAIAPTTQLDPNCNSFDSNNVCSKCSVGFYFNSNHVCVQSDPNCKISQGSLCIECYAGYQLSATNNTCVKSVVNNNNPLCSQWKGQTCISCSKGTYANQQGICTLVNPLCQTFDPFTGNCLSCYPGYSLNISSCVVSQNQTFDPFCKTFNNNVCVQCSTRYYLGFNSTCQQVNPYCNTYDLNSGACKSCFAGYLLQGPSCVVSNVGVTDANCAKWNGTQCVQCSVGSYFSRNGTCTQANPLCATFDQSNGNCLSCYPSYVLQLSGTCLKDIGNSLSDPNCASFIQGVCTVCSKGYFFGSTGICTQIDPNCQNFDIVSGQCFSCYSGYTLSSGNCIKGTNQTIDPNCASFSGQQCTKCSKGFYFNQYGVCTASNPLCNTFDQTNGACTSCFPSYVLSNGICIVDNSSLSDPNCASWLQGVCITCAPRTFINFNGVCQNVNPQCNTYSNSDGSCTSCYSGFALDGFGSCVLSTVPNSCNKFDQQGNCIQCAKGSYLSNSKCIQIDPQCASFDIPSQTCSACYSGYSILNGACQISKVDTQYQIENCYAYNSQFQCIKCYDKYYLSGNSCAQVSIYCKTFNDANGNCLSCYTGYKLNGGQCSQ